MLFWDVNRILHLFVFALDSYPSLNLFYAQVINYDMPQSVTGYIHRIGRTGRAYSSGSSVSLVSFSSNNSVLLTWSLQICKSNALLYLPQVSPDEMEGFEEIKSFLAGDEDKDSDIITPFPSLTENAVESLRYRAEVSNVYSKNLTLLSEKYWSCFSLAGCCKECYKGCCSRISSSGFKKWDYQLRKVSKKTTVLKMCFVYFGFFVVFLISLILLQVKGSFWS